MFGDNQTVLVIGAHPDDEVLGAGGTIAKHADMGDEVHVLILTEGTTEQYKDKSIVDKKKQQAKSCAKSIGVEQVWFGDLPDMRLKETPHVEINAIIEDICDQINPNIVYTHSRREVNQDHVAVHDSTLVATRPTTNIQTILTYETPSSTDFSPQSDGFDPNVFVDITAQLDRKIDAFSEYKTEVREFPHPRSEEALISIAKARGAASGMEAAEAFELLRSYR